MGAGGHTRGHRWTAADTAVMIALHGEGKSVQEIAQVIGCTKGTVSLRADKAGLDWTKAPQTANAAAVVALNGKARRLALRDRALSQAEAGYDVLEGQVYKTKFKGSYGKEEVREIDFIPPNERRDLSASIAQHIVIEARLASVDEDRGVEVGRSMLGKLAEDVGGELAVDQRSRAQMRGPVITDV